MRLRAGTSVLASFLVLFTTSHISAQAGTATACTSLAQQQLPNTTITTAQAITTGSFTPTGSTNAIGNLPPFCRVSGVIAPTSESQILFEVWLPLEAWNGKFAGVGNGGWAGTISFGPLAEQLRRGYAAASTNTGHEAVGGANMARFAFEKPEQLIDFAFRSHHETNVAARTLTQTFYGKPPQHSYFIGCSSGGYEGLMEAQRFPGDYDGIVAGMPANNWTRLMAGRLRRVAGGLQRWHQAIFRRPRSVSSTAVSLPRATARMASRMVSWRIHVSARSIRRCWRARPIRRLTRASDRRRSKRPAAMYGGLKDPQTGAQIYPGLAPGSEPFWPNRDPANPFPIPVAHYKWLVFADPNWDWKIVRVQRSGRLSGPSEGRSQVCTYSQCDQSQPQRVSPARWQAAAVPRLERSADHAAEQHQLLRECSRVLCGWPADRAGATTRTELLPIVHGAGHGALRRRNRSERLRHADSARAVGRTRRRCRQRSLRHARSTASSTVCGHCARIRR